MPSYEVIGSSGSAADLHAQRVPEPAAPVVRVQRVTKPALVLGSSQDERVVDLVACARAGVDVARRRSGGGAVLLTPGEVTWLDVIVPRGAPGWDDDIHRPMVWLGHHLREVLHDRLTTSGRGGLIAVHEGPLRRGSASEVLCFDGLGAGELTLDGAKLAGISQRRTRGAARLQCSWYSSFDWRDALDLLAEPYRPPLGALAPVATVPDGYDGDVAADLAARLSGAPA